MLCEYTGARRAVAVVNGTAALHISLKLASVGPKMDKSPSKNLAKKLIKYNYRFSAPESISKRHNAKMQ